MFVLEHWRRSRLVSLAVEIAADSQAATTQKHYYAHDAVCDVYCVIAASCGNFGAQIDLRVGIAKKTSNKNPWVSVGKALTPAPELIYCTYWRVVPDGSAATDTMTIQAEDQRYLNTA